MKTTLLKRSKKNNTLTQSKFAFVIFVCILLAGIQWIFPSALFRIIYFVSLPFTTTRNYIGSELFSIEAYLTSKSSLAENNASLRKDLLTANIALLSMQELETQNQSLENMIGVKKSGASISKTVFATVTAKPPFSPYDYLTINAGSNSGTEAGNPVFSDDGTPIGIIDVVYPSSAKVLLFSSSGTTFGVVIGDKKFETTVTGAGGGNFYTKIPAGDMPKQGDPVYIPQFIPKALGIIENVSAGPTDAFAKVLFSFPENIFEISYVTIDTSSHFQVDNISYEATSTNQ